MGVLGRCVLPLGIERSSCSKAVCFNPHAAKTGNLPPWRTDQASEIKFENSKNKTLPVTVLRDLNKTLRCFDDQTQYCVTSLRERVVIAEQTLFGLEQEASEMQNKFR